MAQRILINQTAPAVPIPDTGFTVPAGIGSQLVIDPTQYGKFEGSSDVIVEIGAGVLVVNDGTFDLSITEGTRLIQGGFSRPISDGSDPTIKAGVTDATGTTEYDKRLLNESVIAGLDNLAAFRRVQTKVRGDGLNALVTDATVVVETTFGQDQQPDSWFKIVDTGGAGTTWTLDIAGTTADPSAPDRDVPAYQKVFTVLGPEAGDELAFRDRVIQELNQDVVFKNTVFLKAEKATDRGIIHIFSEKFSLSGEFYERPLAGDFNVTIGGAPGDGVVVIGFDNLISRSKAVSITKDFDSPHRLGLFGITGQVFVTAKDLSDLFIERASEDGLGVNYDLGVNGSGTPVEFLINASPSTDVFVEEIRLFGQGNGIQFKGWLTSNNPLNNGLQIEIQSDNIVTILPLLFTTADIKNKFALGQGDATGFRLDIASGRDEFLGVFKFANPFIMRVQGTFTVDDHIKITVADNLQATQAELEFLAKGFEKEP
jgi:hypothetical protein